MAPPLVGASTVSGRAEALIDVVLQGRDVDPAFPAMSPLTGLSDDQLAAILTYIRQAWGHTASAVSADLVRARRSLAR
jgi:mono/diheme cytochrome c family protein